jgi:hypothetical protein
MISLDCFACKSKISAPDQAAGRSGKCPKCGALLLFPSAAISIQASEPPAAKPEIKLPRPKRKKFAKKETSRLPVYLACTGLGLAVMLAVGLWVGVSFYLDHRRTQEIQEKELAELERKRALDEKQTSFLTAQQQLDEANLKFRQKKQEKDQAAMEELDRQNRELKQRREKDAQERTKEFQTRVDQQVKEAQEKEKATEQEKRREAERKRQLEMIEEDHKAILAYKKIHIKVRGTIRDILWSPPLRAVSVKGKEDGDNFVPKEGFLYRLQGVVGENRNPVSYYFLIVNRECVGWQSAKSSSAVTMCKIIGDLSSP